MIENKIIKFDKILRGLESFVVAFSGGVDSSFLLYRARSLGDIKFIGITIKTPYIPDYEINEAIEFAGRFGIKHEVIDLPFPESIRNNPEDRCYICKKTLFSVLNDYASEHGYNYIVEGTNADDTRTYRPGIRALKELEIISPLLEAGLTKNDIRELLRKEGLSVWDKPALACLLTRIPYNNIISEDVLKMVEKSELFLFKRGYPGTRVRAHGDVARIECQPGFFEAIMQESERETIINNLKKFGFRYVSLDLEGYRSGSADKVINNI